MPECGQLLLKCNASLKFQYDCPNALEGKITLGQWASLFKPKSESWLRFNAATFQKLFEMESKSDAADALAGVWRAGHEYTGEAVLEDDGVTKLVHVKRLRRYPCCPLQRKISDTEVQVGTNVRAKQ